MKGTFEQGGELIVHRPLCGKRGEHAGRRLAIQSLRKIDGLDGAGEPIDTGNHVPGRGKIYRALPPGCRSIPLLREEGASTMPLMRYGRIRLRPR